MVGKNYTVPALLSNMNNMIAHHLLLATLILLGVVLVNSNRNSGASFSPIREVSTKNIDIYDL